jgi:predicted nucleic acid-binding protein
MGLIVDTNVFIKFEKNEKAVDLSSWGPSDKVYVSAMSVAELLIGVHRANTEERKQRRSNFVEAVISAVSVLDFGTGPARLHAEITAELGRLGLMIGAHDLIIGATARYHDLPILTDNVDEFSRIPGLRVIPYVG